MNKQGSQKDPTRGRERYFHGYGDDERKRLGTRNALNNARFLLPHLQPGMRLLDCGCGTGSITVGLAEVVAPGEVVGIDIGERHLEAARELAVQQGLANIRFEQGSVYEIPFEAASFDAVFAHTLLLHLSDPVKALKEMRAFSSRVESFVSPTMTGEPG